MLHTCCQTNTFTFTRSIYLQVYVTFRVFCESVDITFLKTAFFTIPAHGRHAYRLFYLRRHDVLPEILMSQHPHATSLADKIYNSFVINRGQLQRLIPFGGGGVCIIARNPHHFWFMRCWRFNLANQDFMQTSVVRGYARLQSLKTNQQILPISKGLVLNFWVELCTTSPRASCTIFSRLFRKASVVAPA